MIEPYKVVSCANCSHKMISERYRDVIYPDSTTPKNYIHTKVDESLPVPQTYGCTCGHFTVIGRHNQVNDLLNRWSKK